MSYRLNKLMNTFIFLKIGQFKNIKRLPVSMGLETEFTKKTSVLPGDCGSDPREGLLMQSADPGRVQEPGHEQPRVCPGFWRCGSE